MKLTSLAIIFTIITSPFLFISSIQSNLKKEDTRLRIYYDSIIDNSIQDAALTLSKEVSVSYQDDIDISNSRQYAAQIFFDSLYHGFNAYGYESKMARINSCVPVLIFLETEGYYFYAMNSFRGTDRYSEIKHCWFPINHYIGDTLSGRYVIRYTLGKEVYVYDIVKQELFKGDYKSFRDEITHFNDPEQFENMKLLAIKHSVEKDLKNYLEQYNEWAFELSLPVKFEFPSIDDADWKRAIKDEGIITFAQGFPVITGRGYRHYAFGAARVIRKKQILGYLYKDRRYYCRPDCKHYNLNIIGNADYDQNSLQYFTDAVEAAKNGYYPCSICRP